MKCLTYLCFLGCSIFSISLYGQRTPILDSGGKLSSLQASYDVTHYGIRLNVDPQTRSIDGSVTMTARVDKPLEVIELDLDTTFQIGSVDEMTSRGTFETVRFKRDLGKIFVELGSTRQKGEMISLRVTYAGHPREAPMPPWQGGFTWATTPSGAHWIATSCQGEGADIWWPCKDHVSDEPDSIDLIITVPEGLYVASNGALIDVQDHDHRSTFHWHGSQPINIYTIALNIAPYEVINESYTSVTGESFPFIFYVLPEDLEKGRAIMPEFKQHMRFYEELLGPYPFRADKYGVVQTPHLGMEHQTIIAYGANFDNNAMTGRDLGFDALHHHELAHEWWGNLVTNASWEDAWIHEGFGSYMQALYCEKLGGQEAYYSYMLWSRMFGAKAIAPRETLTSREAFAAPIYTKGAWVLHTLRNYIGDEAFFESLRKMAYPDSAHFNATDGSQCRFVTTDDYQAIAEEVSGLNLTWFFDLYVRSPDIPKLVTTHLSKSKIVVKWELPDGHEMPIPVDILIGDETMTRVIPGDGLTLKVPEGKDFKIDPYRKILCRR